MNLKYFSWSGRTVAQTVYQVNCILKNWRISHPFNVVYEFWIFAVSPWEGNSEPALWLQVLPNLSKKLHVIWSPGSDVYSS